jgi:hypothetical protein
MSWLLVFLSFALLTALLFIPIVSFLRSGAARRRSAIINTFPESAIQLYFDMFAPGAVLGEGTRADLEQLYDSRYGRRHYIVPIIILLGVAGILVFWATTTAYSKVLDYDGLAPMPDLAIAAVAGAYMWVVVNLQQRHRASDLTWQQLSAGALRLAIAIPVGYAFSAFVQEVVALPIAFMLGAFPTNTIITMGRRIARTQMSLDAQRDAKLEIEALQGANRRVAERFEDEGITTIVQLAYADVIDLTIRTGYGFSFVVDCASQALAWLYLEERLAKVRVYGFRGAQEVTGFIDDLDADASDQSYDQKALLRRIAKELSLDSVGFENMLREIAEDPYTEFLWNIWLATEEAESEDETESEAAA